MLKKFLIILILTFSFQSWTKANSISEFEIEGMSIGDSLLDYFSREELESNMRPLIIGNKKYSEEFNEYIYDDNLKLEKYDYLALIYKRNDPKFIVESISARIEYSHKNINECYKLQNSIIKEIRTQANNAFEDNQGKTKHRGLPNGNSFKTVTNFLYDDNSVIHISCYDFSKKDTNSSDRISVSLMSPKFIDYQKKAFGN